MNVKHSIAKPWVILSLTAALMAGCAVGLAQTPGATQAPKMATAAQEKPLSWTTPANWQERPGSILRLATFTAAEKDGQKAEATIVPLLGSGGTLSDNVNRWRSQIGLPALDDQAVSNSLVEATIGTDKGQLYEAVSTDLVLDKKSKGRVVSAFIGRGDATYFFKLIGPDALVSEQKPVFLEFLKSIKFSTNHVTIQPPVEKLAQAMSTSQPATPAAASEHPDWSVPANWKPAAASAFLVAKFSVSGSGDEHADINISSSTGTGGGILPNVNRWRGQLGLAALPDQASVEKLLSPVTSTVGTASIVDLTGTDPSSGKPVRLVAIILSKGHETWFYKMLGDSKVVEQEKAAFVQFVQTVKY